MVYRYRPRRKFEMKKLALPLLIAAVGIIVLSLGKGETILSTGNPGPGYTPIQLVAITDSGIVLGDRCNNMGLPITRDQVFSIRAGLGGGYIRPLTHDVYKSTLDHFGIRPVYFTMDKFENDLWFATLRLQKGTEVLDLEVRPSDGVAMSVRYGIPMYMDGNAFIRNMEYVC